jgi:hypothetical protein
MWRKFTMAVFDFRNLGRFAFQAPARKAAIATKMKGSRAGFLNRALICSNYNRHGSLVNDDCCRENLCLMADG